MKNDVPHIADNVIGYALALYAILSAHANEVMGFLGFLLLAAKLVQELPRAYRVLTGRKPDE
jgi:hypothetical protein